MYYKSMKASVLLKEELKSEGWTFVDDDEQNRTNDMNLTHTFKKPVYIGIQQIRANLSNFTSK